MTWIQIQNIAKVFFNDDVFGTGSFSTARTNSRGVLNVLAVSCMNLTDREQHAWTRVRDHSPSLMLQVGDNVYSNATFRSMIWAEHLQQRGVSSYANVARYIPTLATWDDHDFGPNNSAGADVERDHRNETASAFRELFPELPYVASRGIYQQARWGDVEFFILDTSFVVITRQERLYLT